MSCKTSSRSAVHHHHAHHAHDRSMYLQSHDAVFVYPVVAVQAVEHAVRLGLVFAVLGACHMTKAVTTHSIGWRRVVLIGDRWPRAMFSAAFRKVQGIDVAHALSKAWSCLARASVTNGTTMKARIAPGTHERAGIHAGWKFSSFGP